VVWYGKQGQLEYDLELEPEADARRITMRFEGAKRLVVDKSGDLRVELAGGSLSLKRPEVYQESSGGRQRIAGGYQLRAGNEVVFDLAAYDKTRPLVIDPTLVYATYFGSYYPAVTALAVDGTGNIYMGGYTSYGFIPAVNSVEGGLDGQQNAFVAKFDPTGKTLLYSTYLGGSQADYLQGMAVDSTGNLVGVGETTSPDFPLANGVQAALGANGSAFAFKLNAAGNQLMYSTYLGGSGYASGYAVALDATGSAYITGYANNFQTTSGALNNCCTFVEKLSPLGGEVYAALIGANNGQAIAVDAQGAAYIAGNSTSSSFPNYPPGARRTNAGGVDAFVAKLSPTGASLVWATFLGGSGNDSANAISLGTGGLIYIGGQTSSADLPVTAGVVQTTYGGGTDAFLASLSADGSSFGFVTYLGGGKADTLASLAAGAGALTVAGNTTSSDFPTANAIQPAFPGSPNSVLKSTNSGVSFTSADKGLPTPYYGVILPDPSSAGTVLIDTGQGVFRSTDDGATWTNVEPHSNGGAVRSLSKPSVLYAEDGCNLYESTDAGQTWNSTYTNCALNAAVVAVSPTTPNTVLLFSGSTEYRSTDGGTTFPQTITAPFSTISFGTPNQIVASPDGSLYAFAGASGLYKSADAGLTWSQLGNGAPAYPAAFALSASAPSTLYASDGSSVYKSTNAGASWSAMGVGTGLSYLAVDPSNALHIYGSASGGVVLTSSDGGATWVPTGAVLDTYSIQNLAVSPLNSAEIYVSNYVPQSGFVSKLSLDGKTLLWSTYYGSYGNSLVGGAAPAPSGDLWVAGSVDSGSLPLTTGARNGNAYANGPAFLARIGDTTAACTYAINPGTQYSYSAGRLVFSVTAPSGCAWTVTAFNTWIHPIRTSGTGSGTIPLAVDANTTASTRTGTVSVSSQIYTIVQPASTCTYQASYTALTSAGGTATIAVTAPAGCPWDVELANNDAATVTSGASGTGNGSVTVSVPPNGGVASLSYNVLIGGYLTGINEQSGCVYSFPNGTNILVPADALQYSLAINANLDGCAWNAYSDQPSWLTLNNPYSQGSGQLSYTVALNNTGMNRIAHITIGSQQIALTQSFTLAQFNDVPVAVLRDQSGSIRLSTYASSILSNSGGSFASDPSVAQDNAGNKFVTARDNYNAIWANVYNSQSSTWAGWRFGGGAIQGLPAIAVGTSGTAWIASRDSWNSYWLVSYTLSSGFGTWVHLAGVFATDPVAAACSDGSIYLIGKDNWNALWSGRYVPGTGFQGWQFGGGVIQGKPAVTCGSDNAAYIAGEDNWNSNWLARVAGNKWTGWFFGGAVTSVTPRIVSLDTGAEAVVILDSTGAVYRTTFAEGIGNGWQPWVQVGGVVVDVAPAGAGDQLYFVGRATNGVLWWWRQSGSQWTKIGNAGVTAGALCASPR